jgi:hypothetical protein
MLHRYRIAIFDHIPSNYGFVMPVKVCSLANAGFLSIFFYFLSFS